MSSAILVTGGTGFVGSVLLRHLAGQQKSEIIAPCRRVPTDRHPSIRYEQIGDMVAFDDWDKLTKNVDTVIHLAGRAHQLNDQEADPLKAFMQSNCHVTTRLAKASAKNGVKHFIFVSSIGVNGTKTSDKPLTESSEPAPVQDYAKSKMEAEKHLIDICANSKMAYTIVRPPLVYGKGAPGNMGLLIKLTRKLPFTPFGLVNNARTMIDVRNLSDFLSTCIGNAKAHNELFLVADRDAVSLPQIMTAMAAGMDKSIKHLPVPVGVMRIGAILTGQSSKFSQISDDLVVSANKANELLGWTAKIETRDGLSDMTRRDN